jgi:hypothetical protein
MDECSLVTAGINHVDKFRNVKFFRYATRRVDLTPKNDSSYYESCQRIRTKFRKRGWLSYSRTRLRSVLCVHVPATIRRFIVLMALPSFHNTIARLFSKARRPKALDFLIRAWQIEGSRLGSSDRSISMAGPHAPSRTQHGELQSLEKMLPVSSTRSAITPCEAIGAALSDIAETRLIKSILSIT